MSIGLENIRTCRFDARKSQVSLTDLLAIGLRKIGSFVDWKMIVNYIGRARENDKHFQCAKEKFENFADLHKGIVYLEEK